MTATTLPRAFAKNISSCPCLCLDSISSTSFNVNANSALCYYKDVTRRRRLMKPRLVDLSTSFLDAWQAWRLSKKMLPNFIVNGCSRKRKKQLQGHSIVGELGGQYEDTFNDVKKEIIKYFTFKAVSTVLEQLYEMNPPQYAWFNNFVADNVPNSATQFLQTLVKERQELAERVMITRLSLYGRWIKKCDHGEIYNEISEENLKLMRDRLMETIIWPTDEPSTDDKTD